MPNPKRRHSRQRRDKRRANEALDYSNLAVCPECKMPKMPHRVCPHCGFYKGRQIVQVKKEEKKK